MESDRKVKEKSEKEENLGKIPFYATIYHPKGKQLVDELLGKHTRRIFDIPLEEYTDFEKQKLIEFYEYVYPKNIKFPKEIKVVNIHTRIYSANSKVQILI
jgi:hypothetical protein